MLAQSVCVRPTVGRTFGVKAQNGSRVVMKAGNWCAPGEVGGQGAQSSGFEAAAAGRGR